MSHIAALLEAQLSTPLVAPYRRPSNVDWLLNARFAHVNRLWINIGSFPSWLTASVVSIGWKITGKGYDMLPYNIGDMHDPSLFAIWNGNTKIRLPRYILGNGEAF